MIALENRLKIKISKLYNVMVMNMEGVIKIKDGNILV